MTKLEELIKTIWFPLLLLLIVVCVFFYFGGRSLQTNLIGSFGGALVGVILGFIAEMIREGIGEFNKTNREKKIYLRLLEEDAKSAHHGVWLYTRLISDPDVPSEIKNHIPAEFDLRY